MPTQTESSLATRPSLLARLKDWSQQTAWREFDRDYAPLIRNVARKAGLNDAEADEVVQETLLAVAKKIGEFQHAGRRGSFRAWLFQQARWRIADQFRARARANGSERRSPIRRELGNTVDQADWETGAPMSPGGDPVAQESANAKATLAGSPLRGATVAPTPEADPAFESIWNTEWEHYLREAALACVKRQVSARQYQLFDLHVLQGLPVRATAKAAGTTMAAVYGQEPAATDAAAGHRAVEEIGWLTPVRWLSRTRSSLLLAAGCKWEARLSEE